ncbi:MAG: hypothetical protein J6O70_02960 [Lachnospiraceae bacterium]|nr:hypothetical protein [Lachnospiraceae bacterium]
MNKSQCQTVMEIMNGIKWVELKRKLGGKFHFPMYMTQSMKDRGIEDMDLNARSYHSLPTESQYGYLLDVVKANLKAEKGDENE